MIVEEEKVEIIEEEKLNSKEDILSTEKPKSAKQITLFFIIFLGILFGILIVIFGIFTYYNSIKSTISQGIYINGVDVSGLSLNQAKEKLQNYYKTILSNDIVLINKDYETYITPEEIELEFDIISSVNYAYGIGKQGNIFNDNYEVFNALLNGINIVPTYTYNKEALTELLNKISSEIPDAVIESSYYQDGNKLIITKGKEGYTIDIYKTISNVQSKLIDLSFANNKVEIATIQASPSKIDVQKIHKEVFKEAVDASYTKKPYAVYPSSTGLDFKISVEEAKKIVEKANGECEIPLKTLYPKVTTNDIGLDAFPNLLAEFSTTYYASNKNRTTNLKLAANKINGCVLLPDEIFSYNGVVGERTISAGYKEAATYVDGAVVDGLGGGICQISTTLFNTALMANLDMVELYNHQFIPSYVGAGRDATVVYGVKDFKFKNTRNYAIKITCTVSGGVARFKIFGVKEKDEYNVRISSKITSRTSSYIKSTTYRTLSKNGKNIKTEKIYSCTYKTH